MQHATFVRAIAFSLRAYETRDRTSRLRELLAASTAGYLTHERTSLPFLPTRILPLEAVLHLPLEMGDTYYRREVAKLPQLYPGLKGNPSNSSAYTVLAKHVEVQPFV